MTSNQAYRRGFADYHRGVPLTCPPIILIAKDDLIPAGKFTAKDEFDARFSCNYEDEERRKSWWNGWQFAKREAMAAVVFVAGEFEFLLAAADPRIKTLARDAWSRHPNNPDRED